jgi:hypothetical protein
VAISSNYITLQRQIADELGDNQALLSPLSDSSLTASPIKNAIQSAISKWEREPFYFNEFRLAGVANGPFNTVSGQEYYGSADYASIPTLAVITKLWVLVSGNRYTMNPRTKGYLDDTSVNPSIKGQPVDYAYDALQLRFYPIPDNVYPIGIDGTQRLSALAVDADANAWTQDAYDLIRCEAKLILAREVLNDEEVESAARRAIYGDAQERGYLSALRSESARRHNSGRIRPTHF